MKACDYIKKDWKPDQSESGLCCKQLAFGIYLFVTKKDCLNKDCYVNKIEERKQKLKKIENESIM